MADSKKIIILSVASNGFLTAIKLAAGVITGSVSLLSEALHSFGDLAASLIAFYSIIQSNTPADLKHQFGHGKYEDMAGFLEALLIVLSALFILYTGFCKLIFQNTETYVIKADLAIIIMVFSVAINFIVGKILLKKGKECDSNAILGDGEHLMADVYSSFAVILGLAAVKITGFHLLDPVIAIVVAAMILKTGISLMGKTADSLLDSSLPYENIETINKIINEHKKEGVKGVKSIKTSKSGSLKNIVLVIYMPCMMTLSETDSLCDKIEGEIEKELKNTNVLIHPEPDYTCEHRENCAKLSPVSNKNQPY